MSRPIHGKSTAALKFLRKEPAALAVYWCYVARSNIDGVAWPSGDGLARDTGWDKATCLKGRSLLVELKALELVEKYIRPQWRGLTGKPLSQKLNLDRSEYYRPTATITVKGVVYNLLYVGAHDENDIDNFTHSVPRPPSMASHMQPDTPELALSSSELGSNKKPVAPKSGATDTSTITDIYHAAATNPTSIDDFTTTADSLTNADTRQQPFEALKDEITAVWGWDNQGVLTNIAKMLAGKFKERDKASEYKAYQFDNAMTADELRDWSAWYRRTYPKMSLPQRPDTIAKSVGEYRASKTTGTGSGFDYQTAFTFVEG